MTHDVINADFMDEQLWSQPAPGGFKAAFTRDYVVGGKTNYEDMMTMIIEYIDYTYDEIIDKHLKQIRLIDRCFSDMMLPLAEQDHLEAWLRYYRTIGVMLEDLDMVLTTLFKMTGQEFDLTKNGVNNTVDSYHRLLGYRAVEAMVASNSCGVSFWLRRIAEAVTDNLQRLLAREDVEDAYRSVSWRDSEPPVTGAEYWCEELFIAADAARLCGYADEVKGYILQVIGSLDDVPDSPTAADIRKRLSQLAQTL